MSHSRIEAEEQVELLSVGIDVGSATSSIMFSRITLAKVGSSYHTVGRDSLYASPPEFTPYTAADLIDADRLGSIVQKGYVNAGVRPEDVHSGALILTGNALLRQNSRAVGEVFAQAAGRLVAVSAGDGMEALLAAHGSGAVELSRRLPGPRLHCDIGGGTTKLALLSDGYVQKTVAVDAGARVVVTDESGGIRHVTATGSRIGEKLGVLLREGSRVSESELTRVASYMAEQVMIAAGLSSSGRPDLCRADGLPSVALTGVSFSGGPAEYIYGRTDSEFGDLGKKMAAQLKRRFVDAGLPIDPVSNGGIRATVIGASQYTVQLSGSTIWLPGPGVLPVRNVQVAAPRFDFDPLTAASVAAAVAEAIRRLDIPADADSVGIAFDWSGSATYENVHEFAAGLKEGIRSFDATTTVVLISSEDVGSIVGRHIVHELGESRPIVSLDCIRADEFDFIDVGDVVPGSLSVPVVVKSLVFPTMS